jgi:ribosomal protein S21
MKKGKKNLVVKLRGLHVDIPVRTSEDKKKHINDVTFALLELKKLVKKEDLISEFRSREAYMSPSKARRYKTNESIKQRKRDQKKQEWYEKNNSK